jgi:general secretion pathway protein A
LLLNFFNSLKKGTADMFLSHFQLQSQPFAEHTPVERLWNDQRMTHGLARLQYLATGGTLGLLSGGTGLGKSALLRRLLHELRGSTCETCYRNLVRLPALGVLQQLVRRLGETPLWHKEGLFCQVLERAAKTDGTLLVVLDEAHLLPSESLIDLRLLVSSNDAAPQLKLLLTGQEGLLDMLRRDGHRDLWDRIMIRYHLHPLGKPQTRQYLEFQMQTAGGSADVFATEVKDLMHDYTGGVPRQINNLATACLLSAAASGAERIDETVFRNTVREFHLPC